MRTITVGSLRLEPLLATHAVEMFEVLSDPAIYTHENTPPPSVEWLRARYTRQEARQSPNGQEQWLNWVVRQSSTGRAMGYVQATIYPDHSAAIAYEFASAYWGLGYARSAVQAMISELLEHHPVRHIFAIFKQTNQRSAGLLLRLGLTPIGSQISPTLGYCELAADERGMYLRANNIS